MDAGRTATTAVTALAVIATALVVSATWPLLTGHTDAAIDLAVAGLALGGLAFLVTRMSRAPAVALRVEGDQLAVRFSGWDRLWTLRRDVRVPLRQVERVTVRQVDSAPVGWRRHRGTALPGLLQAGSFTRRGARELWDVRTGADAVDVELAADAPFRRMVLELPDPPGTARRLRAAMDRPRA